MNDPAQLHTFAGIVHDMAGQDLDAVPGELESGHRDPAHGLDDAAARFRSAEQQTRQWAAMLHDATNRSLSAGWVQAQQELERQTRTWQEATDRATITHSVALAQDRLPEDLTPDCSRNPRARCALVAARLVARKATRAYSLNHHPGSPVRGTNMDAAVRLARIAWTLWRDACRIADSDPEQAARVQRLAELFAQLAHQMHATVPTPGHRHTWTHDALAPPGRRCVARHIAAHGPPVSRTGVGCTGHAPACPWSPGASTT